MVKIEAITLEKAYADAAKELKCSVTELKIEVVQIPTSGFLGFFKKSAIIVAVIGEKKLKERSPVKEAVVKKSVAKEKVTKVKEKKETAKVKESPSHTMLNDTIMPTSFVSDQDDEDEDDLGSGLDYTADYDDAFDENDDNNEVYEEEAEVEDANSDMRKIATEIEEKINKLFRLTCFNIDHIDVSVYDSETLLVEFKGDDAALLIGKEGYRYKAISYMVFNWINSEYDVQLRLEIAEFLKNQEESISRYISTVCENIEKDGRAQTKVLDGVLVQIALKELRAKYPNKYVAIRSTRDGLKYIIVNEYNNY